jgi:hypothetical protein
VAFQARLESQYPVLRGGLGAPRNEIIGCLGNDTFHLCDVLRFFLEVDTQFPTASGDRALGGGRWEFFAEQLLAAEVDESSRVMNSSSVPLSSLDSCDRIELGG